MREVQTRRFSELTSEIKSYSFIASGINALAKEVVNIPFSADVLLNWRVRAKSHIANTCGMNSLHYSEFEKAEVLGQSKSVGDQARLLLAVFTAAEHDFITGGAPSVATLSKSEVFNDELDQAQNLLDHNYVTAAAVIASIVLESKLRCMCVNRFIAPGKLDRMNSDLVKAEAYDLNTQKRITAIAGIRNSAAHGKVEEFTKPDVQGVIDDVRRFLEKQID